MRQYVTIALLLFLTSVLGTVVFFVFFSWDDDSRLDGSNVGNTDSSGTTLSGSVDTRNPAIRELPGYDTLQNELDEQERIENLSTVSSENLATQVETDASGNKRLASRRLLLNNLKTRNIKSASELIAGLEDIRRIVSKEKIILSDTDIMILLSGLRIEMPANDPCSGIANLTTEERWSSFLPYVVRTCGEK